MESQGGQIFRAGVWTPRAPCGWQGRVEELAGFWVAGGSSNWTPGAAPAAAALGPGGGPRAVRILLAGAKRRAGAHMPASEEWWQGNPLKWEPGRLDLEDIPGRRRKRNSLAGDAGLGECGAWWRAICLCVRPGRVLEVGGGGPGRQRELKRAGEELLHSLVAGQVRGNRRRGGKKTQLLRSSGSSAADRKVKKKEMRYFTEG